MSLVIRLTPEERAELERRRAAGGFRSLNETVKAWLATPPIGQWESDAHKSNERASRRLAEFAQKAIESGKPIRAARPPDYEVGVQIGPQRAAPGSLLKKR